MMEATVYFRPTLGYIFMPSSPYNSGQGATLYTWVFWVSQDGRSSGAMGGSNNFITVYSPEYKTFYLPVPPDPFFRNLIPISNPSVRVIPISFYGYDTNNIPLFYFNGIQINGAETPLRLLCRPGSSFNLSTGLCEAPILCPSDTTFNPSTGRCEAQAITRRWIKVQVQ
jgi:hypothetical protein